MLSLTKSIGATILFFLSVEFTYWAAESVVLFINERNNGLETWETPFYATILASFVGTILALQINEYVFKAYPKRIVACIIVVFLFLLSITEVVSPGAGDGRISYLFLLSNAVIATTAFWSLWWGKSLDFR